MIAKNGVILLVQIESDRAEGMSVWDALVAASNSRFRPLMLTALSTVLGMIPIAPTVFWGPMAFAIMGGLLVATLLTLVFLPTLYATVYGARAPARQRGGAGGPPRPGPTSRSWRISCRSRRSSGCCRSRSGPWSGRGGWRRCWASPAAGWCWRWPGWRAARRWWRWRSSGTAFAAWLLARAARLPGAAELVDPADRPAPALRGVIALLCAGLAAALAIVLPDPPAPQAGRGGGGCPARQPAARHAGRARPAARRRHRPLVARPSAVPRGDAARPRRRGAGRHRPLRVADAAGAAAAHPRRQPARRRGRPVAGGAAGLAGASPSPRWRSALRRPRWRSPCCCGCAPQA